MVDLGCGKERVVSCLRSHDSLCIQYPFLVGTTTLHLALNTSGIAIAVLFFSFSNLNLCSNGVMGIGIFKFPDASNYPFPSSQWLNVHDVSWAQITKNPVFSSLNFFPIHICCKKLCYTSLQAQLNGICYYSFVCVCQHLQITLVLKSVYYSLYVYIFCSWMHTNKYLLWFLGQGVSAQLHLCQERLTLNRHCSMIHHCSDNRKSSGKQQMLFWQQPSIFCRMGTELESRRSFLLMEPHRNILVPWWHWQPITHWER